MILAYITEWLFTRDFIELFRQSCDISIYCKHFGGKWHFKVYFSNIVKISFLVYLHTSLKHRYSV